MKQRAEVHNGQGHVAGQLLRLETATVPQMLAPAQQRWYLRCVRWQLGWVLNTIQCVTLSLLCRRAFWHAPAPVM